MRKHDEFSIVMMIYIRLDGARYDILNQFIVKVIMKRIIPNVQVRRERLMHIHNSIIEEYDHDLVADCHDNSCNIQCH